MTAYFYDTSALNKHYHPEPGTAKVDALLGHAGATHTITKLASVELHSAFAKKCRAGLLTRPESEVITRGFRADVRRKRFRVVRLMNAHHRSAVRLIRRHGPTQNLRTLDALQLAVALSLNDPITFVCADQALCAVAAAGRVGGRQPGSPLIAVVRAGKSPGRRYDPAGGLPCRAQESSPPA